MNKLLVFVEISGKQVEIGEMDCLDDGNARFRYADDYIGQSLAQPISVSLPLQAGYFSQEKTKCFFEGLLPEGFARKSVAKWMHRSEKDYLGILAELGNECIGAIRIVSDNDTVVEASYEKMDSAQIVELAKEGAVKSTELMTKAHLSLTGASGKVGLYLNPDDKSWYLPHGDAPSTHIVKQSHIRLNSIVTNEQLSLMTARKLGIETPDSFIINTGKADESEVLFATKRYDRTIPDGGAMVSGLKKPLRLHQEDFAQALGIAASEKYEQPGDGYVRAMFRLLAAYSAKPIDDQLKLWDMLIFDHLIGNADNHIKNFSLLYDEQLKNIRLAPAYDIVSTAVYETSTRDMGLSIGGEISIDNIDRDAFAREARNIGLGTKIAMHRYDEMAEKFSSARMSSAEELGDSGFEKAEELCKSILEAGGIAGRK